MKMQIIEKKKIWFSLSIAIILVGMIMGAVQGFNFGIDFTGGTMMHIDLGYQAEVATVKDITDQYELNADIVHAGTEQHEVIIKTKQNLTNAERIVIFDQFKETFNLENEHLLESQQFGPSIGKEIQNKALLSIIIAAIGMLIYITIRFEIKFAIAAIIALLHDILILIAFYAIFRFPINSPFVAALLTIVGYSINDTIVVFDRIRENLRHFKKKQYSEVVNVSVQQTVRRSINTSVTTLLTIVCLYVLGVDSIKQFALPLIAGIISGTYSSIFIASPIWYMLHDLVEKSGYERMKKSV